MGGGAGEALALPSNILRTMPYTAYVAVGSYAVVFASADAAWLEGGMLLQEVLNAAFKWLLRRIIGDSSMLRRPDSAADSGIYPQHHPRPSTTSGMPSGHSQASGFLATVLTLEVLRRRVGADGSDGAPGLGLCLARLRTAPRSDVAAICYLWLVALLVVVSRTRLGGILAVKVDGRRVAQHTLLQVAVGLALGVLMGVAATEWYRGRDGLPWLGAVAGVLAAILLAGLLRAALSKPEAEDGSSSGSDKSDQGRSSDETASGGSDSSSTGGTDGAAGEIELRSRPPAKAASLGYSRVDGARA